MRYRFANRRALLFLGLVLVSLTATLPWPPQAAVQAQALAPSPLPTPGVAERPDACERNDQRDAACNLPLDSVSGPFTFLPVGDQDWYRVDLGQPNGLETRVSVRADDGLDLLVTLSRDDGQALGSFATPAISTTLAAAIGQPILIRVENRAPRDPVGRAYTIEARRILPPPPDPTQLPTDAEPDALENNWDPDHASSIGVDVVYDLTFACPERRPGACPGGDHDYLRFPIKAGTSYLIATFDLGPGVDTVLDLYLDGQPERPLLSNDDARASGGLLSALRWTAPQHGMAILRVGPRAGAMLPVLGADADGAGSYRLVVALGQGELASTVEARIAEQTNAPMPTQTSGSAGSPRGSQEGVAPAITATTTVSDTTTADPATGSASARIVQGDAVKGQAITLAETTLRLRPAPDGELIELLPPETVVSLIGKHSNLWVRVQTDTSVLAGWVLATDLRRYDAEAQTPMAPAAAGPTVALPPAAQTPTASPAQTSGRPLRVTALAPMPVNDQAASVVRITRVVTVSLRLSALPPPVKTPLPGQKATAAAGAPAAGLRIQLVNAFGDLLAEAIAPASGELVLTRETTPEAALFVRLPQLGLLTPVPGPQLLITLPEVVWQP